MKRNINKFINRAIVKPPPRPQKKNKKEILRVPTEQQHSAYEKNPDTEKICTSILQSESHIFIQAFEDRKHH